MPFKKMATAVAASAGLAAALLVSAEPAQSAMPSSDPADERLQNMSLVLEEREFQASTTEEQLQARIADRRIMFPGITDAEAIANIAAADAMLNLASKLESEFYENYAYHEVELTKEYRATLYLKNAPKAALDLVAAIGPKNVTIVNTAKYNARERVVITRAAHVPIATSGLVSSVSSRYDHTTDSVAVSVRPAAGVSLSEVTARAGAKATLAPLELGITTPGLSSTKVSYVGATDEAQFDAVMSGGTALGGSVKSAQNPDVPLACTAGFGIFLSGNSNTRGIMTAEHCGTRLSYEAAFMLSAKTQSDSSVLADARSFFASGHSARRDFIWAKGRQGQWLTKPATGTAPVGLNERVCHFGHATQDRSINAEKCTYVESLSEEWSSNCEGGCYNASNQIRTTEDYTERGDSGGPWYVGNNAVGIHSNSTDGYARQFGYSQFSTIRDAQCKTGTFVITFS